MSTTSSTTLFSKNNTCGFFSKKDPKPQTPGANRVRSRFFAQRTRCAMKTTFAVPRYRNESLTTTMSNYSNRSLCVACTGCRERHDRPGEGARCNTVIAGTRGTGLYARARERSWFNDLQELRKAGIEG